MITANVVRAVEDLLKERGIQQKEGERLGDYVARGLNISDAEAAAFLEHVHEGDTVEEAQRKAGIALDADRGTLLIDIGRAIGQALGRISR
ncbi:MAG TPA: hypothetical protein VER03_21900 [Bryobacteraceae bacterium]|nr:hypothetical protein [Bryobacteraceae bacterium]